jgi:hypothetical protein
VYFTITIDTEEDNWGQYDLPSYTAANIARIPRLQDVFVRRGVRPTYLITYPIATDAAAVEMLGAYRQQGLCEIGTHPHPWNTPPLQETRTTFNSYISNLTPSLQYRKIRTLHEAITKNLGAAPTAYRSGRWGFNEDVARNLIRLGYSVDTSISPASDWSEYEGIDYSSSSLEPFVYRMEDSAAERGGTLLEVPATIGFVQRSRAIASNAYWTIKRKLPAGNKILAALSRLRLLNHVCISPETHDASHMIRLTDALMRRGTKVVNMFFHSPSLLEGCSPFVRTETDVRSFIARIDQFLAFAQSAGLKSVTMSELRAADVGASGVKMLEPSHRTLRAISKAH